MCNSKCYDTISIIVSLVLGVIFAILVFCFPSLFFLGILFGFLLSIAALFLLTITASSLLRQDKRLNDCICAKAVDPGSAAACSRNDRLYLPHALHRHIYNLSHPYVHPLHADHVYFLQPVLLPRLPHRSGLPPLRLRGITSVFKRKTGRALPGAACPHFYIGDACRVIPSFCAVSVFFPQEPPRRFPVLAAWAADTDPYTRPRTAPPPPACPALRSCRPHCRPPAQDR